MKITGYCSCGIVTSLTGDEQPPRCKCGLRIKRIHAGAPVFRGAALGPCSKYEDLPAKAVTLKKETSNG